MARDGYGGATREPALLVLLAPWGLASCRVFMLEEARHVLWRDAYAPFGSFLLWIHVVVLVEVMLDRGDTFFFCISTVLEAWLFKPCLGVVGDLCHTKLRCVVEEP